jgi:hypothetical protein
MTQTMYAHMNFFKKDTNKAQPQQENQCFSWVWWYVSVISAFGRLKQNDLHLETSLGYKTTPCFKKKKLNFPPKK